jgi:hypothetical protein
MIMMREGCPRSAYDSTGVVERAPSHDDPHKRRSPASDACRASLVSRPRRSERSCTPISRCSTRSGPPPASCAATTTWVWDMLFPMDKMQVQWPPRPTGPPDDRGDLQARAVHYARTSISAGARCRARRGLVSPFWNTEKKPQSKRRLGSYEHSAQQRYLNLAPHLAMISVIACSVSWSKLTLSALANFS